MARTATARNDRARRRPRATPRWARLSDAELLELRFCDLELRLEDGALAPYVAALYDELETAGISFRPHCWLAEEWFSPDGIPGIAIPFYLAHRRLLRLERRMMREAEGGNANWMMRILRHEAGHALDSAYRLRRRRRWREVFGPASLPYPDSYRPRPGSRRFVEHLDAWYAQSHPTEDFAETFAVWLKPGGKWRRRYRAWPALGKLEYVEELMQEIGGEQPSVRTRATIESLSSDRRTLAEHYRAKLARYGRSPSRLVDIAVRRVFASAPPAVRPLRAATLLRRHKDVVRRAVAARLDVSEYFVHQVQRLVIQRAAALRLYARPPLRHARRRLENLVLRIARLHLSGSVGRHLL